MKCRHCGGDVTLPLIDLGTAPPSNAYLTADQLSMPEKWYPLRVRVCESCWLVQTEDFTEADDLFSTDYAYFSSYSTSWLQHAERFVDFAARRFELGPKSTVVEVAANDGYLLQYVRQRGIPCYGIEPTHATATTAREKGVDIVEEFFGRQLAEVLLDDRGPADLIVANNVLAHVPDINDFAAGVAILLKPAGIASFEFPHVVQLVEQNQFDTIYHEHFSYLSLTVVSRIFQLAGLSLFDVQTLPTHGGSLRVFAQRIDAQARSTEPSVDELLQRERDVGIETSAFYEGFQDRACKTKHELMSFLLDAHRNGKQVAAYGAAAKGNTLLNFAGVRSDLISFVVDRNPAKQGKFLPGSRIPIVSESAIKEAKPAYVLLNPWNLKAELHAQLRYVRSWGGRLATAVPRLQVR